MRRRISTGLTLLGALMALLLTGCGGFSGSHSVSPATFLLPGIIENKIPMEPTRDPNSQNSLTPTPPAETAPEKLPG